MNPPTGHKPPRKAACEPMSQILVYALAPGKKDAAVKCTSTSDFLVYCSTNGVGGYAVGVQSTAASFGTAAPNYIVGGMANDVVTIIMQPGTTGFITLQARCDAKASIKDAAV